MPLPLGLKRPWDSKPALAVFLTPVLMAGFIGVGLSAWQRARRPAMANVDPKPAKIDGERAYKYLKQICEIGPRHAGSEANTRQREMVAAHFKKMGASIVEQKFRAPDPRDGRPVPMVNLIGMWHPERLQRVVVGVHYDTRPFPDEETDPDRKRLPFIGANDGASGVAMLMEISHHLKDMETPWGVDLVLFDGEELVFGDVGDFFLGSTEFARRYANDVDAKRRKSRYAAGLVLDMVGDADLKIEQEQYSLDLNRDLVREVWTVARKLKADAFHDRIGQAVRDDHLPLNNAGIPTIDIIDFDYKYWHKAGDLPAECSASSLEQVGRVVTGWLSMPRRKAR